MSASDHFDFWICYRGPKNKKYVFFLFFPRFHIWGGEKLCSKLGLKNHFCEISRERIRDRGIVSMDEFCVFECEI